MNSSPFEILENPYPGKSTILNFPFNSKKTKDLVLPGVFEVLAIFKFVIELTKEDFPTFERPQKTISGISSCGRSVNL